MKYRLVISLIAFMAPFFCKAQQDNGNNFDTMEVVEYLVPDYDKIGKAIKDKNSEFYYPNLVKMLANADTSITLEQLHYLYYGYVLQDNYDPYLRSDEEKQALDILNKDDVSEKEARKVIKLMDKAVKEYPTHLKLYFYRYVAECIAYGENSKQASDDVFRYVALINAITASGDGSDFKTALHVAIVNHSYSVMSYYGIHNTSQSLQSDDSGQMYDVFPLEENEFDLEKLYVNVTPCLNYWSKIFGE
ncbi:MAG: DUF4919 domain-containing protein [Bacteroidales bacterium]|nr:DUF4919 domain-containing protein [Bacteroidales bacterium]